MSADWGFYHTFTTNLRNVPNYIAEFPAIGAIEAQVIRSRVDELLQAIEDAPKSMKWRCARGSAAGEVVPGITKSRAV